MKPLRIFVLLCLVGLGANAQYIANNKRVADVYFLNKEYYAAAEYYKKALQISPDSMGFVVPYAFETKIKGENPKRMEYEYCVFQLATSLRLYKDFRAAEAWYALAKDFSDPKFVLAGFYYGECLRANQKFVEAIPAFEAFQKKYKTKDLYDEQAKVEIASCNFALYEMRYPRLYKFSKIFNQINGQGSNYTPVLMNNDFYFTSSRPVDVDDKEEVLKDSKSNSKVKKKETPYINAIYKAMGSPVQEATTVKRIGTIEKGRDVAAPAFHPNGQIMYLTSWTAKGNRKICVVNITKGYGDTWSAPKELGAEVNVNGFNSMQPFVTRDGKFLLFSSDRPGGIGKYDIWFCAIRPDGSLGQASNMGSLINTRENEEAPYYNYKTKKLLYSTAGKVGLGGLDFFESEGDFVNWSDPINMGYPFNSSKDDSYFTPIDDTDEEGYVSSDRESVCCLEMFYVKKEFLTIEGSVLDCMTGKPLSGAMVTLSDSTQEQKVVVAKDGKYKFRISSNRKLRILAQKENYFNKVVTYNYEELAKADTLVNPRLCLVPRDKKPIVLKDILYDFNSAELNPHSEATLDGLYNLLIDNPDMEIELSAHTDNIGSAEYNLDLSNKRAQSCVNYLVKKGIPLSRLSSKGYGFSRPIAPNKFPNGQDNFQGRQLNRRTEFVVTKN